jgi:hypothetical protein
VTRPPRYTYTATSFDGSSCGHAHPTREEAKRCRTRRRVNITRGEEHQPESAGSKASTALFLFVLALSLLAAAAYIS